jgi:hypothetical protein
MISGALPRSGSTIHWPDRDRSLNGQQPFDSGLYGVPVLKAPTAASNDLAKLFIAFETDTQ